VQPADARKCDDSAPLLWRSTAQEELSTKKLKSKGQKRATTYFAL
jgi:hypothetical protein